MLDIKFVRQNFEFVQEALRKRGEEFDLKPFLEYDTK